MLLFFRITFYLSIKGYILRLDKDTVKNIILDFDEVKLVDHTVMAGLANLKTLLAERWQILSFVNADHLTPVSHRPLAARLYLPNKN